MELRKEPNKHLTYDEREFIEIGLNQGRNFTEIGKDLNKDRRTISREILKHRFKKKPSGFNNSKNLCESRHECKKIDCTSKMECYKEEICYILTGAPYVCNGCEQKNRCRKIKYYYYSKFANDEYNEILKTSRYGINLSKEDAYDIDKLITPLIKEKHQSIAHIYANLKKLFEVVLTDNGREFFNPMSIEKDEETGEIISHVFYCDPSASWQKGAIEKNDEYIRYVLPKGSSFDELTQDKTNTLMSHINSTSRDILNGKTPYDATLLMLDEETIEKLGVIKVKADEVNLSPKLLKEGDK